MMLPGMYTLQIAATDVYSNHDYYHLQYTSKSTVGQAVFIMIMLLL